MAVSARTDLALFRHIDPPSQMPRRLEMPQQAPVRVHVAAAGLEDVGEPRARLSRTVLETLGLQEGAHVRLIAGDRSVLLHAYRGGEEDDGLDVVRLDGSQRRNLHVQVGDSVVVEPFTGRRAERICLVAVGNIATANLPLDEIRDALAERPVVVGDTVKVTPTRKTFGAELNVLGLTLAGVTGAVNDADGVMLRVFETIPPGVVEVDEATHIDLRHAAAVVTDADATRD